MSKLKVAALQGLSASSDAITLANDGTCTANITNNLSNRNLIINGAMQVAQRGDVTGANSSGYKALDRFRHTISIGTWSISQSTDSPDGFANSMKMDCTTAEASPASASALAFVQKIEGQNLQHLKKGTSGALNITVSFHIKCTKTGTAVVNLIDEDNTRMIGQQFTINSADTWEKKTLTFAGDTSGVLGNDANSSLRLEIWLDAGSSYKSGSVQSSWATLTTANYFAGGTLNLGDNTSNDVFITGVQLEVGSVATDFEHRSFAQELALCERYYEVCEGGMTVYGTSGTYHGAVTQFSTKKRANPTVTRLSDTAIANSNTPAADQITTRAFRALAQSNGAFLQFQTVYSASCEL